MSSVMLCFILLAVTYVQEVMMINESYTILKYCSKMGRLFLYKYKVPVCLQVLQSRAWLLLNLLIYRPWAIRILTVCAAIWDGLVIISVLLSSLNLVCTASSCGHESWSTDNSPRGTCDQELQYKFLQFPDAVSLVWQATNGPQYSDKFISWAQLDNALEIMSVHSGKV